MYIFDILVHTDEWLHRCCVDLSASSQGVHPEAGLLIIIVLVLLTHCVHSHSFFTYFYARVAGVHTGGWQGGAQDNDHTEHAHHWVRARPGVRREAHRRQRPEGARSLAILTTHCAAFSLCLYWLLTLTISDKHSITYRPDFIFFSIKAYSSMSTNP